MYGSIMRARIKDGKKDAYLDFLRELLPTAEDYGNGLHSVELAWEASDPQRVVAIIHFADRDSYVANANRPETDADFRRQLEFFEGEPEWLDLDYVGYMGKPMTATVGAGVA